jgi:hypothetical protein
MKYNGLLATFPKEIKVFVATFVIVLSIGFYTGLLFVSQTGTNHVAGIEENYLGNEESEAAEIMKFKKSPREMLTIIHTHVLSMSFIFFLLGGLVWLADMPKKLKLFLTIEPFFSIIFTFGGIYFLWLGVTSMKYVVMVSGILMTASFVISTFLVLFQLMKKPVLYE